MCIRVSMSPQREIFNYKWLDTVRSQLVHKLQHTTTHCNTLQHIEAHCSILQHTATHCNALQHTATQHLPRVHQLREIPTHRKLATAHFQVRATHYKTLQHTATSCNTHLPREHPQRKSWTHDGIATICRLLSIIEIFCKRDL